MLLKLCYNVTILYESLMLMPPWSTFVNLLSTASAANIDGFVVRDGYIILGDLGRMSRLLANKYLCVTIIHLICRLVGKTESTATAAVTVARKRSEAQKAQKGSGRSGSLRLSLAIEAIEAIDWDREGPCGSVFVRLSDTVLWPLWKWTCRLNVCWRLWGRVGYVWNHFSWHIKNSNTVLCSTNDSVFRGIVMHLIFRKGLYYYVIGLSKVHWHFDTTYRYIWHVVEVIKFVIMIL